MKKITIGLMFLSVIGCQTSMPLYSKYPVPEDKKSNLLYLGINKSSLFGITSDYVVAASLKRKGDFAWVDVLMNTEVEIEVRNPKEMSQVLNMEFDCKTGRQFRFYYLKAYSEVFANGQLIKEVSFANDSSNIWRTLNSGTQADRILRMACYTMSLPK